MVQTLSCCTESTAQPMAGMCTAFCHEGRLGQLEPQGSSSLLNLAHPHTLSVRGTAGQSFSRSWKHPPYNHGLFQPFCIKPLIQHQTQSLHSDLHRTLKAYLTYLASLHGRHIPATEVCLAIFPVTPTLYLRSLATQWDSLDCSVTGQ